MRWVLLSIGVLGVCLFNSAASAGLVELITNGSFESPMVTAAGVQEFSSGVPGWTGTAGIEIQSNGVLGSGMGTPFGTQYAELAVEAPSTYSQTVNTTPGQTYFLSFYLADRPGTGADTVSVGFSGNAAQQFTVQDTGAVAFQNFKETFVATGPQSVLSFQPVDLKFAGGGDLIDNVSLTTETSTSAVPVPPALWTALSVVFGLATVELARRFYRQA